MPLKPSKSPHHPPDGRRCSPEDPTLLIVLLLHELDHLFVDLLDIGEQLPLELVDEAGQQQEG